MNILKEYREERYLSQADMARLLMVSAATYLRWEKGTSVPSRRSIADIAKLINKPFEDVRIYFVKTRMAKNGNETGA